MISLLFKRKLILKSNWTQLAENYEIRNVLSEQKKETAQEGKLTKVALYWRASRSKVRVRQNGEFGSTQLRVMKKYTFKDWQKKYHHIFNLETPVSTKQPANSVAENLKMYVNRASVCGDQTRGKKELLRTKSVGVLN